MLRHIEFDKENSTSNSHHQTSKLLAPQTYETTRPVIQKAQNKLSRKVLGDINNQQLNNVDNASGKTLFTNNLKLENIHQKCSRSSKIASTSAEDNKLISAKQHNVGIKNSAMADEKWWLTMDIENADTRDPEEDNCEDVIPMDMRPSSYLRELMTWRPSSLAVIQKDRLAQPDPIVLSDVDNGGGEACYEDDGILSEIRDAVFQQAMLE